MAANEAGTESGDGTVTVAILFVLNSVDLAMATDSLDGLTITSLDETSAEQNRVHMSAK